MLAALPQDCQRTIFSFLEIVDLLALNRTNQACRRIVQADDFAEAYVLEYFAPRVLEQHKVHIRRPFHVLSKFGLHMAEGEVSELVRSVVDVSSLDRAEESPENVLTLSRCYQLLGNTMSSAEGGEFCQLYCGCSFSQPCYWSSRPTGAEDSVEFLTFQLRFPASIVVGFYVWPYQAFFHPNHPVYGPREVSLQLLLPLSPNVSSDGRPLNMRLLQNGFVHDPIDLQANVYYQSPFYSVANVREKQCFLLPQAVLNLGGEVRLLFRGMHQRQPGGAMQLTTDDFYMCISRADVLGIAYENFHVGFRDDVETGVELTMQPRDRPIKQQATYFPLIQPAARQRYL